MPVELTPEQHQQVDAAAGKAVDVIDPATHKRYVLLPQDRYDDLRDAIDQQNLRNAGLSTLARRLAEGE